MKGSRERGNTEVGLTHRVVTNLLEPVCERGHHVYMNNYFTSPALFDELKIIKQVHVVHSTQTVGGFPMKLQHRDQRKERPQPLQEMEKSLFFICSCGVITIQFLRSTILP